MGESYSIIIKYYSLGIIFLQKNYDLIKNFEKCFEGKT